MAETTSHETDRTRAETAAILRAMADALDSDQDHLRITVGNKDVQLSPPDTITTDVKVTERSRRLRKNVEKIDLSLRWHPATTAAPVEAESTTGSASDS